MLMLGVDAVHLPDMLRLVIDAGQFWQGRLHAEGGLVVANGGFDFPGVWVAFSKAVVLGGKQVELAALKVSLDSAARNANAQFTRIGERVDKIERTQGEPAAKLSKAIETLERLSRDAAPSKEVTGSVAPLPSRPGAVEGWVLRDARRGTALIEGRIGVIEVEQGDMVPGLGRVEAVRKQDGRWVVVTSKGLIMPPR